jgi:hypothetical protein
VGGVPLVRIGRQAASVAATIDVLLARGELGDLVRSGTLGAKGIAPRK